METKFDWYKELESAIKDEPSRMYANYLSDISYNWVTCAVGQLSKRLPINKKGKPKDKTLSDLGFKFHFVISYKNWKEAMSIVNQIEERTAELLNELRA